ncbi:MAG: polysaccharide deacetylase family protein [Clostridia bacterium]|nr:polysaccharide deacetylase family protein [Clostridia bacterium]
MKLKNGYTKVVTFSFDDGNIDDIRLIELFKKYGLKGTFNLSSGCLTESHGWTFNDVKYVKHINYMDHPHLYDGFEVAVHSYRHPRLDLSDDNTVYNEIKLDQKLLECMYGYKIRGMALPFGKYNERTAEIIKDCGIKYCRTVMPTYNFEFPQDLILNPTCHFKDPKLLSLAEEFINAQYDDAKMFYIWGHSYELITEDDWTKFEDFCKLISGKSDIWYCNNIEAIDNIEKL